MTSEQFKLCPKEKLLEGAQASFVNAQSHFRVAEKAASIEEYGIGNSLLILSVYYSSEADPLIQQADPTGN